MMSLEDRGYTPVAISTASWTQDIEAWLFESVQANYEIERGVNIGWSSNRTGVAPRIFTLEIAPYVVWFETPSDAVLFKLTWGGAA